MLTYGLIVPLSESTYLVPSLLPPNEEIEPRRHRINFFMCSIQEKLLGEDGRQSAVEKEIAHASGYIPGGFFSLLLVQLVMEKLFYLTM